jgi:hypothetical protein
MPLLATEVRRMIAVVDELESGSDERADAVAAVFRCMGDHRDVWVDTPRVRRNIRIKARELGRARMSADWWLALCGEPPVGMARLGVVAGHIA